MVPAALPARVVSDADTVLMSKDQNLVLGARALGIATADLGDRLEARGKSLSPDSGPSRFLMPQRHQQRYPAAHAPSCGR